MHSLVRYCGHHRGRDLVSSIGSLNNYERDGYKNVSLKIEVALFQTSNADDFFRSGMLKDCYGVRGVSQIKFTMSDSFLVFYDFDILSMIKRKNPFRFYCVILILNLSRLISPITILILKVCRV